MKMTLTPSPLIGELEEQPRSQAQSARSQKLSVADEQSQARTQASAYLCKAVVIVSGIAMIYGIISYGRVFQNYLQW